MSVFEEVRSFIQAVATVLPSVNDSQRRDIRDGVGKVADTIEAAVNAAIGELQSVKSTLTGPAAATAARLRGLRVSLADRMQEHRMCEELQTVQDRFSQIFHPARFAVAVGRVDAVRHILAILAAGRVRVIDALYDMLQSCERAADELENAAEHNITTISAGITRVLNDNIDRLEREQRTIREAVRQLPAAI